MSFATQEEFLQLEKAFGELCIQVCIFHQQVETMRNEKADLKFQMFAIEERENLSDAKLIKLMQDLDA